MSNLVGTTLLNRYHIESFVGRGGMAEVYKVWDAQRATYLAMKLLREDLAEDRVFLRRFKREAETLARLQHPSIVRFYGLEQDGPMSFMLMDYIEGTSLRREIFQSEGIPLPDQRIREVMRPICSALHYAHSQGMIHCDIKPGNILIDNLGRVLVSDFGIARMTDGATATMVGMGTPAYMAPEQVLGQAPLPQTDIYAVGVVLYEMLTGGERPFTGERAKTTGSTSEKVRWEQLKLKPASLRKHNPAISRDVEAVMLRCLSKEPEQRYPAPLDLLNALELAMEEVEPAAPPRAAEAGPTPQVEAPVVDNALSVRHKEPLIVQPVAPEVREDSVAAHPPARNTTAPTSRKPRQRHTQPAQEQHRLPYSITIPKTVWMGGVYLLVVGIVVGLLAILGVFGGGTGRASVVPTLEPTATNIPTLEPTATLDPMVLCRGAGIPESACTGVTRNADWTPYIEEINGVKMALVPVGCFQMGSEDSGDEQPVHEVCFEKPFWVDVYEVTNEQYGSIGCEEYSSSPKQPRNCVSWAEAQVYCQARGARLPTEAEWEYAARGADGLVFPWGNMWDSTLAVLNTSETVSVGSKAGGISWVGAYDLSGNVWEWVSDWYGTYPSGQQVNPKGPGSGEYRVLRGGSGDSLSSGVLRAAIRDWDVPGNRGVDYHVGFRCALSY